MKSSTLLVETAIDLKETLADEGDVKIDNFGDRKLLTENNLGTLR